MLLSTGLEPNLYVIKIMFKGKLTFMKTKDNNNSLNKMSCLISYRNSPDFKKNGNCWIKKGNPAYNENKVTGSFYIYKT